jgi:hypothetical protein
MVFCVRNKLLLTLVLVSLIVTLCQLSAKKFGSSNQVYLEYTTESSKLASDLIFQKNQSNKGTNTENNK